MGSVSGGLASPTWLTGEVLGKSLEGGTAREDHAIVPNEPQLLQAHFNNTSPAATLSITDAKPLRCMTNILRNPIDHRWFDSFRMKIGEGNQLFDRITTSSKYP